MCHRGDITTVRVGGRRETREVDGQKPRPTPWRLPVRVRLPLKKERDRKLSNGSTDEARSRAEFRKVDRGRRAQQFRASLVLATPLQRIPIWHATCMSSLNHGSKPANLVCGAHAREAGAGRSVPAASAGCWMVALRSAREARGGGGRYVRAGSNVPRPRRYVPRARSGVRSARPRVRAGSGAPA